MGSVGIAILLVLGVLTGTPGFPPGPAPLASRSCFVLSGYLIRVFSWPRRVRRAGWIFERLISASGLGAPSVSALLAVPYRRGSSCVGGAMPLEKHPRARTIRSRSSAVGRLRSQLGGHRRPIDRDAGPHLVARCRGAVLHPLAQPCCFSDCASGADSALDRFAVDLPRHAVPGWAQPAG